MIRLKPQKVEDSTTDWKSGVASQTLGISSKGYFWVAGTLGLFLAWGFLFPLSSSVVSSGKVVSSGQNKLIQHPLGGVVRRISADDGALLKEGDLIVEIEPASAKAELARLAARQSLLLGQKARLESGKHGTDNFDLGDEEGGIFLRGVGTLPAGVSPQTTGALNDILTEQQDEFNASAARFKSELSELENRLAQQTLEQDGLELQISQQMEQVASLQLQHRKMKPLVNSGYVAKARLWELETRLLDGQSQQSSLEARADGLLSSMDETRDRIKTHKARRKEDNAKELSSVLAELAGVTQQLEAAQQALDYSLIKAPVSGTLVKLQTHTIGGVIEAGEAIAEIVPEGQPLIVETRVLPLDIGQVKVGQDVEIAITAFSRRTQEPLPGRVSYVAADSSIDQMTGETYFTVRAEFDEVPQDGPAMKVGMQSDVFINTGSRSFMSYLAAPVTDSIRKAFNEQ